MTYIPDYPDTGIHRLDLTPLAAFQFQASAHSAAVFQVNMGIFLVLSSWDVGSTLMMIFPLREKRSTIS